MAENNEFKGYDILKINMMVKIKYPNLHVADLDGLCNVAVKITAMIVQLLWMT